MTDHQQSWHHFRPVHHLRHFAGSDGRVWVHDRRERFPPRQDRPKNLGAEYFLYSPGHSSNHAKSDEFERWLAKAIDGPAASPLARAAQGELSPSPADRVALAKFIATQDMRTPLLRDLLVPFHQKAVESSWLEITRTSLEALGIDPTDDDVMQLSEAYRPSVNNVAWTNFIRTNIVRSTTRLGDCAWTLIEAPSDYPWLTNDIGIVKCVGSFDNPVAYQPAWLANAEYWIFPVSSQFALAIAPDVGATRAEARSAWLKRIDKQMVLDARESVFARDRCNFVHRWWQLAPCAL